MTAAGESGAGRFGLPVLLVWVMTGSSFYLFAVAVLTVDLLDEFGLSRTMIGLIGAVNTMVGAVTAPWSGRVTDRIGPRSAALVVMVLSGASMAVMALAPNAAMLTVAAVIGGLPQGWGNPATNALIAERVPVGARGTVTGIKQSGVQFGIFLSGLTLPTLALWIGWRGAVWVYAIFFWIGIAVVLALPRDSEAVPVGDGPANGGPGAPESAARAEFTETVDVADDAVPPWIWRLTLYALLAGTVGGASSRFFPLWAHEVVGMSVSEAGLLVAAGGLLGIVARIAAGKVAEALIPPARLLRILALIGAVYCVTLVLTPTVGAWLPWPSTILQAVGIGAWNAVAMLAIIMVVPRQVAGRASGIVMLGFLSGLSFGSPMAGFVVDRLGSYQPVWIGCMVLALVASVSLGRSEPQVTPVSVTAPV